MIVQAYEPAARAVQLGARHAVEEFLTGELERRRAHALPPFGHLVRVVLDGERPEPVARSAVGLADAMRARAPEVGVLGPSPMHRLRGRTRRALLLSAPVTSVITTPLRACLDLLDPELRRAAVRAAVDVDPQDA